MKIKLLLTTFALLYTFFGYSQSAREFEKSKYGRNPKAGHYISIRGFNMYYETYGKGEPLLIIHGNGGSIINFLYQIPYFSKQYQVIAADSRAQGKSIDMSDSLSYEMMADDFNALLDSLKLDSCYILGHSDGAINGLLLAIRHPGKLKKLAVAGANLVPDTSSLDPWIYRLLKTQEDSLLKLPETPDVMHQRKLITMMSNEPQISIQQLKTITCPTLVISGDHDLIRPEHTVLIAKSIPKSNAWIIPNSGHSGAVFYKDLFNKTVKDFFKRSYKEIEGEDRLY